MNFRQLTALIAVLEHGSVVKAAESMNVSQPAVTKLIRDLENSFGVSLFTRSRAGMVPTAYGEALAKRAKLAFAELRRGREELSDFRDGILGRVAIGSLPYVRTVLVPRATIRLLEQQPRLEIAVVDGTYDELIRQLRAGEIDLIVGTLRHDSARDGLVEETLFYDQLAVVARTGHPLTRQKRVTVRHLGKADWVLPRQDTPQHQQFERLFMRSGIERPANIVSCNSLEMTRALLLESDRLTVASRHRLLYEEQAGLLAVLPIELKETRRAIGLTMNARTNVTPAVSLALERLREVAAEIQAEARP